MYLSLFMKLLFFFFLENTILVAKKIAVKAYRSIGKVFGSLLSLQKNTIQKYLDRINHNPYSSGRLQRQMQRAQAQAHAAIPILGYGLRIQALLLSTQDNIYAAKLP